MNLRRVFFGLSVVAFSLCYVYWLSVKKYMDETNRYPDDSLYGSQIKAVKDVIVDYKHSVLEDVKDDKTLDENDLNESFKEPEPDFRSSSLEVDRILTEEKLREFLHSNCYADVDDYYVKFNTSIELSVLPMQEYKTWLAHKFTQEYSNPPRKINGPVKLTSYEGRRTPQPAMRLHNASDEINITSIEEHVERGKLMRLKLGDDDLLKIPEVLEEIEKSEYKIPNIVHFIWFGNRRKFVVDYYLAMLGALRFQKPKLILFHCDTTPRGPFWNAITKMSGPILRMVKRTAPTEIFGEKMKFIQHQADVARIEILMEVGGIYLDTDSVIHKSIDTFRNNEMVMSQPAVQSLTNAVILASRESWFLRRWYHEYKYFANNQWGLNSFKVPWSIAMFFPDTIRVVTGVMCRPNWFETNKLLYRALLDWSQIYITHLFSRGRKKRPLKELAVLNTTYGEIARHVIWGDKKIRDVTDWIVTCDLEAELTSVPLLNNENLT